jgi:acetyltransferase-like isoleucine patch superfamily enzyme
MCIISEVTIDVACVIGDLSLVTKDFRDYSIAVGFLARVVREYDFANERWKRV